MENSKNLKRGNPDTQFKSGREQVEISRKGGKASGASKRRAKSLKDAAIAALNETYYEPDGEVSGYEKLIHTLFTVASDPSNKNCISAIRFVREIVGENVTAEDLKMMKKKLEQMDADIAYRKKATDEMGWS